MKKWIVSVSLASFVYAAPAEAAVIMSYQEVGTDVVGTLSGSLDLTGMTATLGFVVGAIGVQPNLAIFSTGQVGDPQTGFLDQIVGPSSFGPGGATGPNSSSGSAVFLTGLGGDFWVPAGYVSGGSLNATQIFLNRTIANMGLTPGEHVYTLSSGDTMTVRVGSVPEPVTLTLFGLGLAGIGVRRWRQSPAA